MKLPLTAVAAVLLLLTPRSPVLAADGDPTRGEQIYHRCQGCHSIDANRVALSDGTLLPYDALVVATGVRLQPGETEGLTGPGWNERVFTFSSPAGAAALRAALDRFQGGRLKLTGQSDGTGPLAGTLEVYDFDILNEPEMQHVFPIFAGRIVPQPPAFPVIAPRSIFDEERRHRLLGRILGIVEEDLSIKRATRRKGTLGSAVIRGHVTEILDLEGLLGEKKPVATENSSVPACRCQVNSPRIFTILTS